MLGERAAQERTRNGKPQPSERLGVTRSVDEVFGARRHGACRFAFADRPACSAPKKGQKSLESALHRPYPDARGTTAASRWGRVMNGKKRWVLAMAAAWLGVAGSALAGEDHDDPPISYATTAPNNPVSRL